MITHTMLRMLADNSVALNGERLVDTVTESALREYADITEVSQRPNTRIQRDCDAGTYTVYNNSTACTEPTLAAACRSFLLAAPERNSKG